MLNDTPDARLNRAMESLEGLSVGDAFFVSFEMVARFLAAGEFKGPLSKVTARKTREFAGVRLC